MQIFWHFFSLRWHKNTIFIQLPHFRHLSRLIIQQKIATISRTAGTSRTARTAGTSKSSIPLYTHRKIARLSDFSVTYKPVSQ